MKIEKPHPWWTLSERDFDCPACNKPLADKEERERWDGDEADEVLCPYCGTEITVNRTFSIEYTAEVKHD